MATDLDAHTQQVRRYYEHNLALFERFGQGGTSFHRAVWGPGVVDRRDAFHYVDRLILERIRNAGSAGPTPRVVDLGCGVGGSLIYLAGREVIEGEGITISPRQAERAAALIRDLPLKGQVRCRPGNYLAPPADITDQDLAFSIEAFVHSPDAAAYFRSAAGTLRAGGKLIICDDFSTERAAASARQSRWLDRFRKGWRIGTLIPVSAARRLAETVGLELMEDLDLTSYLELRRLRDRAISLMLAVSRPLKLRGERWLSLDGGSALQSCLIAGLVEYRFLTFQRRP